MGKRGKNICGNVLYAEERISWSMPTFRKRHNILHFAAAKKHIGLYPGPAAVEAFIDSEITYGDFFRQAPEMNPNREKITGVVCGVRVENIEDPLMREI
mgnify:CR=1 FL=1